MTMHDDPRIPDPLADGLRRLEGLHHAPWPGDDPVLNTARARLTGRRRLPIARLTTGLAAAAGLAIAATVWLSQPSGPADRVTMLDAYRLTLMLDRDESPGRSWDANEDGSVDRSDIDALAARAVSLGEASS